MRVGAIIAEYNPFHNGHKYQLEKFRKDAALDYIIVIMSGSFVQRGEPAWMPKHLRAKMALLGGADLVLELPLYYATGSASIFAEGAIAHLEALGCVDALCFGCECDESIDIHMKRLSKTADFLVDESDIFQKKLGEYLKLGYAYPSARASAVQALLFDAAQISEPNNILALEYLLALKRQNSSIIPVGIKRIGPGYHSLENLHPFASASALRQTMQHTLPSDCPSGLSHESLEIIQENYGKALPLKMNDFSQSFASVFLANKQHLTDYIDFNDTIAHLMQKKFDSYTSLNDFLMSVKHKDLTYTRLSRCAIHLITQQYSDDFNKISSEKKAYYARVLGFRRSAAPLLKEIKHTASIPSITKLADYKSQLDGYGRQMLETDIAATKLYRLTAQIKFQQIQKNEFSENLVILP